MDPMRITRLELNDPARASLEMLRRCILQERSSDIHVIVPSFASKLYLRRRVTELLSEIGVAHESFPLGVEILTVEEFASEYGTLEMLRGERSICPIEVVTAIVAESQLSSGRSLDKNVLLNLSRTVTRLLRLREDDLEILIEAGGSKEVVDLTRKVLSKTSDRYVHLRALLEIAMDVAGRQFREDEEILIFMPEIFSETLKLFLEVAYERLPLVTLESIGPDGEGATAVDVLPTKAKGGGVDPNGSSTKALVQLFVGASELDELRIALSFLLEMVRNGIPPSKTALLMAQPARYLPHLELLALEMSSLEGVDLSTPKDEGDLRTLDSMFDLALDSKLDRTPIGNFLKAVFTWFDSDFARTEFVDRVPNALAILDGSKQKTVRHWDRLSAVANVVRTRAEWLSQLERVSDVLQNDGIRRIVGTEYLADTAMEELVASLDVFKSFIRESINLYENLQATSYQQAGRMLKAFLDSLIPKQDGDVLENGPGGIGDLGELDRFIEKLVELDALPIDYSYNVFCVLLDQFLQQRVSKASHRSNTVTVASMESVAGSVFDYMALVGLNKDLMSSKGSTTISIDDQVLRTLDLPLYGSKEQTDRTLSIAAALVTSAKKALLTTNGDPYSLSLGSHPTLARLCGRLGVELSNLGFDSSMSALPDVRVPRQPLSLLELSSSLLISNMDLDFVRDTRLGSVMESVLLSIEQRAKQFYRYQDRAWVAEMDQVELAGVPIGDFATHLVFDGERLSLSPTQLEHYVSCPYAFFVNQLLGIDPPETPEDSIKMPPSLFGQVVHEVLEDSLRTLDPGDDWTDVKALSEHLLAVSDAFLAKRLEELSQYGLLGRRAYERTNKERIRSNVRRVIKGFVSEYASVAKWELETEKKFHNVPIAPDKVLGKKVVSVVSTGKIDLALRTLSPDERRVVVVDYKTGSSKPYEGVKGSDPTNKGTKYQMYIYALAASRLYGTPLEDVETQYWFSSASASKRRISVKFDEDTAQRSARDISTTIDLISHGYFTGRNARGVQAEACRFCNPRGIGNSRASELWMQSLKRASDNGLEIPLTWKEDAQDQVEEVG